MPSQLDTSAGVANDSQSAEAEGIKTDSEVQRTPVAYEQLTLTEEAAELIEATRKAQADSPVPTIRRLPIGDPAKHRP